MTLDAALAYAEAGWRIFPIVARGKTPAVFPDHGFAHGVTDATNDPERIRAAWALNPSLNLGIATGRASNCFVVDVDGEVGRASLAALPAFPETLACETANGHHYYFGMPEADIRNSQNKLGAKIDIRGSGGYVVAPSSVHASGHIYRWVDPSVPIADPPGWLIETLLAKRPAVEAPFPDAGGGGPDAGFTVEEVARMLDAIDPDLPYDDWVKIGMALHHGGYGLDLWTEWSRRGKKFEPGCTLKRWCRFNGSGGVTMGTLVHQAQQWGWKPLPIVRPDHDDDPDILRIREHWAARKQRPKRAEPEPEPAAPAIAPKPAAALPFDPLELPGLIGDTVRWIVGSAVKPQPELALLNTLAALGAVFGRRYVSPLKTCTNLYLVGIAATVSGKDHSRKQIKQLLIQANLEQFMGSDGVRSGVGVMKSLLGKPSQIMHLDEFGLLLQAVADIKGAHYMRAFGKNLLELYSSASSTYDIGSVADSKADDIIIHQPSLCIYGTTTLETYAPALNRSAISSGSLNRFIVLPSAVERPVRRRSVIDYDPPAPLIDAWATLATKLPFWSGAVRAQQAVIDWPGCDDRIFELGLFEDEQFDQSPHGTGALWGRYRENVIKVAMISALSRGSVVTHFDLDFAESIVGPSVRYMQTLAIEHMSDSQHEADCQEVMRHVRTHGGEIGYTDLYRLCRRLNSKQLGEVISSLVEQDRIEVATIEHEGRGRRGRRVRAV